MGSLPLTVCGGLLAVAALGTPAPAAHAADGGTLAAAPEAPAPGADVTLWVTGCTGRQATAASRAFTADARLTGGQGTLSGRTRVGSAVGPGSYDVRVTCADRVVSGTIRVVAGNEAVAGNEPAAGNEAVAQGKGASAVPVDAGTGATAHFATVATSGSGPDTAQAVTGLALASIAAVAVGLRARRRRPR
ncbi:hypothetical protein ACL07V_20530 [Streptomyces sp. MB22_4]|uniref:hypothetical protein n=1 Tax=Streptomyces sp. MB22_4 TaxID=3383120 RepID=UPI0039A33CDF